MWHLEIKRAALRNAKQRMASSRTVRLEPRKESALFHMQMHRLQKANLYKQIIFHFKIFNHFNHFKACKQADLLISLHSSRGLKSFF